MNLIKFFGQLIGKNGLSTNLDAKVDTKSLGKDFATLMESKGFSENEAKQLINLLENASAERKAFLKSVGIEVSIQYPKHLIKNKENLFEGLKEQIAKLPKASEIGRNEKPIDKPSINKGVSPSKLVLSTKTEKVSNNLIEDTATKMKGSFSETDVKAGSKHKLKIIDDKQPKITQHTQVISDQNLTKNDIKTASEGHSNLTETDKELEISKSGLQSGLIQTASSVSLEFNAKGASQNDELNAQSLNSNHQNTHSQAKDFQSSTNSNSFSSKKIRSTSSSLLNTANELTDQVKSLDNNNLSPNTISLNEQPINDSKKSRILSNEKAVLKNDAKNSHKGEQVKAASSAEKNSNELASKTKAGLINDSEIDSKQSFKSKRSDIEQKTNFR